MAFIREGVVTPVAIGNIEIRLYSPDPLGVETPGADYAVAVRFDDGETKVVRGNLVPHLTQGQITGLLSFMADLRVQAIAQILP